MRLNKVITLVVLFTTISISSQAQTKNSISVVTEDVQKNETPTQSQSLSNPTKSPHGHILIQEIPTKKQAASRKEVNQGIAKGGIRGTDIIGEGEYLNFDKTIMQKSITGQIPIGFPKHIRGQSEEKYVQIMMDWVQNHVQQVKEEYRNKIK